MRAMTTRTTTTGMRKTAISVPAKLLAEIDRAARQRGESRSRFIQRLLLEAVRAKSDNDFSRRLDAFFADQANAAAHRQEADVWSQLAPAWNPERW